MQDDFIVADKICLAIAWERCVNWRMAALKYAFQCKHCGALSEASAAGENELPRSCRICGVGDGDPDNWIVLANLSKEELAEDFARHGLTQKDVERHVVTGVKPPVGKKIQAEANESLGSEDIG